MSFRGWQVQLKPLTHSNSSRQVTLIIFSFAEKGHNIHLSFRMNHHNSHPTWELQPPKYAYHFDMTKRPGPKLDCSCTRWSIKHFVPGIQSKHISLGALDGYNHKCHFIMIRRRKLHHKLVWSTSNTSKNPMSHNRFSHVHAIVQHLVFSPGVCRSFTTDYSLEVARPVAGMGPTAGPLRLECLNNPFVSNGKCSNMPD